MEFPWVHPWVLSLSLAIGGTSEEKLGKQSFQSYPSTKNKTGHSNEKIGFVSRIRSIPWVGSGGSWGISWSFLGLGLDMCGFSVVWVWQQWRKHMRWWKSKFQGEVLSGKQGPGSVPSSAKITREALKYIFNIIRQTDSNVENLENPKMGLGFTRSCFAYRLLRKNHLRP